MYWWLAVLIGYPHAIAYQSAYLLVSAKVMLWQTMLKTCTGFRIGAHSAELCVLGLSQYYDNFYSILSFGYVVILKLCVSLILGARDWALTPRPRLGQVLSVGVAAAAVALIKTALICQYLEYFILFFTFCCCCCLSPFLDTCLLMADKKKCFTTIYTDNMDNLISFLDC